MKRLILTGSWLSRLNWPGLTSLVYVDDVANNLVWLSKRSPRIGIAEYLISSESITLSEISRLMHSMLGVRYQPIVLPSLVWRWLAKTRQLVYLAERLTPSWLYNLAWRASLVVDNVIYCNGEQLKRANKNWRPKLFGDNLNVII